MFRFVLALRLDSAQQRNLTPLVTATEWLSEPDSKMGAAVIPADGYSSQHGPQDGRY